jgi:hypothetical protein
MKYRRNRSVGLTARMGRSAYGVLVGKPEGRRQLERNGSGMENDIKMYVKDM